MEWSRYLQFAMQRRQAVPGRDVKWGMGLLWDYLLQRSRTCKPTTLVQIATKLRHFGVIHMGSFWRRQNSTRTLDAIRNMKRQLAIRGREQAIEQGKQHEEVERCTPVEKRGVDMLLSSFRVYAFAAGVPAIVSRRPSPSVGDRDAAHGRRHAFRPVSREGLHQ